MKLQEAVRAEEAAGVDGPAPTRADVEQRVRRFAVLRAAQRALAPSSPEPMLTADLEAIRGVRERLRRLVARFDRDDGSVLAGPDCAAIQDEILFLDQALDAYAQVLLAKLESLPVPQLRASLSDETRQHRTEVQALLQLCMDAEPTPSRYLNVVDLLITLLCASKRDGAWGIHTDPANLNQAVSQRALSTDDCGQELEARIAAEFQKAAQRLSEAEDERAVLVEVSAYKAEIAAFFFVPSVLRCVVGYNVAARNHFQARQLRGREVDSAIDAEIGVPDPLETYETVPEGAAETRGLAAHEAPGVCSVQESIQRRLRDMDLRDGPAARIASRLDLSWLGKTEREAFLEPEEEGPKFVIRMTVLLGHLAVSLPESRADFASLGLHEAQLDTWICRLGDEVQQATNELIRDESYEGALQLGDAKSRFLTAVLIVARRRHDPNRKENADDSDTFERDAIRLLREYLEREAFCKQPPMFFDLLGGGWRRTVAMAAVGILVAAVGVVQILPNTSPRAIRELTERQARDISPSLESAYRDHAAQGSIFVGTMSPEWMELPPVERRRVAEKIRSRLAMEDVRELMLFDGGRTLQAHYKQGRWRSARAWKKGKGAIRNRRR